MAGKQPKSDRKEREFPSIPCAGVSARIIALAAGFDGKPREAISQTSSSADPLILEILSQIAPEFEALINADNRRLVETILVCGNELFRRAKSSDRDALSSLFQAASHLALLLDRLQDYQFDAVRDLASQNLYWVANIMLKPDVLQETLEALKRLEVGKRCSINLKNGARWTTTKTSTQVVNELYLHIMQERFLLDAVKAEAIDFDPDILHASYKAILALPQLSKETSDLWFDSAIWPLFMQKTKGHPEKIAKYRSLGNYRARHSSNIKGEIKAVEANIRDGIKSQLRQALKSMAGFPPNNPQNPQ